MGDCGLQGRVLPEGVPTMSKGVTRVGSQVVGMGQLVLQLGPFDQGAVFHPAEGHSLSGRAMWGNKLPPGSGCRLGPALMPAWGRSSKRTCGRQVCLLRVSGKR